MPDAPPADLNILEMLGDELKNAVVAARGRTGDATIMCRIGEPPAGSDAYPPGFVPGLVSIHRDGQDTVYGLSPEQAVDALGELT